jgi:hypothetical protein
MHVRPQHGAPVTGKGGAAHGVSDPVQRIASRMRTRSAPSAVRRRRRIRGITGIAEITGTAVLTGTTGIAGTAAAPAEGPRR